jgi:hypothetical protein
VGVTALLSPAPEGSRPARGNSAADDHEKDWPHPQLRVALGFWIENPAPWRPSL